VRKSFYVVQSVYKGGCQWPPFLLSFDLLYMLCFLLHVCVQSLNKDSALLKLFGLHEDEQVVEQFPCKMIQTVCASTSHFTLKGCTKGVTLAVTGRAGGGKFPSQHDFNSRSIATPAGLPVVL